MSAGPATLLITNGRRVCVGERGQAWNFEEAGLMTVKKVVGWALLAFLVFYIVTRPDDAAGVIGTITGWLGGLASGFGDFLNGLT